MLNQEEIEKFNKAVETVEQRVGTYDMDTSEFYRAMDLVIELAKERLVQINYNGK